MSRAKSLVKSTFVYFIGSFGSKVLTFLLLPVYANYLTTEDYGNYDLINTIIVLAYPTITLMLDIATYVFLISTNDTARKEDLIAFTIKVLLINGFIAVAVLLAINELFYPIQYITFVITWLLTFSIYSVWTGITRGLGQQKLFSVAGVVVTVVTLIGNIWGLVILHLDYKSLMIANSLAFFAATVFLESRLHILSYLQKAAVRKAPTGIKRELLKYTLPLLPNQLSWWILSVSDRLMIVYFLGASSNGLYAMACKIPAVLNIIHSIFSLSFSDDILSSKSMEETESYANKIYNAYIRAMIGVSVILMAANKIIFTVFIGGNFVDAYKYTYFLYIGFVFTCIGSILGVFYGFYKKSLNVGISSIAAAIVNMCINFVFLEKYGIVVACLSTLIGSVVIWVVRLLGLRGLISVKISNSTKIMFLAMVPFYFFQDIDGIFGNMVLIVVGIVVAIAINFETIINVSSRIIKKINVKIQNT